MFKNFIVISLRNFKRNKFYSFLNIFGLAIGIATAILSFLYVDYELSYDRFHEKSDRIYRIAVDALSGNTVIKQVFNPAPMPAALYNDFSEIEAVCRIAGAGSATKIQSGNNLFKESNILIVDTTFFDIFSAEFVRGYPGSEILAPNKVVLTERTARKYFGSENPLGRMLMMDDETSLQVSAVIKEFPDNAHFHFDMLASLLSFDGYYNSPYWFNNNFREYILLHENQDYKVLEGKLPAFVDKYHYKGKYAERMDERNKWELYLQPLADIHLYSHLSGEFEANGNAAYVYIFGIVAIFILLIACMNFVNLATAKSTTRAREISIRKVVGSNRQYLIRQFLSESLLISLLALILGLLFVELALIYLPDLVNTKLSVSLATKLQLIPALFGLLLGVGILSGIYPSLVLSSFKPVDILSNKLLKGRKGSWLRNTLVIFQFSISIILIISTIVISDQLDFIQNERLGFEKEQVIVIHNTNMVRDHLDAIKTELLQLPAVQGASVSNRLPGIRFNNIGFGAEGFDGGFTLNLCLTDPDFENVLKFKMIRGRYFSEEYSTDTSAIVLNEAAVKLIGWDDPLGKKINNWSQNRSYLEVIGVVEDLHYESMHREIRPMAFLHINGPYQWSSQYLSVRVETDDIHRTIQQMETIWAGFNTQLPFEYSFFDEDYESIYTNEVQTKQLFIIFAMLAIFIACLGLLGLAAFMVENRIREIGIRKVVGASISGLVILLSKQFSKWVLLANCIAWPLAWWAMRNWLENFAYRIEVDWWIYPGAGILALLIAILTVSAQVIKAAVANPVEALRYE